MAKLYNVYTTALIPRIPGMQIRLKFDRLDRKRRHWLMIENTDEYGSDYEESGEDFDEASDEDFDEDSDEDYGEDSDEDVTVDITRFEASYWQVRVKALHALGKLEPAALAQHTDALVAMLSDSHWSVRAAALTAGLH